MNNTTPESNLLNSELRSNRAVRAAEETDSAENREFITANFDRARDILTKTYMILNFNEQPVPLKQFLNNIERSVIHSALLVTGGSQKQAARILGVKQTALCEKIKRLNIKSSKQKLAVNLPE